MKKLLFALFLVSAITAGLFAANKLNLYNVTVSTGTSANIPTTVGIDKASVKLKSLAISNPGAVTQVVRAWQDVSASTSTATLIATWTIPASTLTSTVVDGSTTTITSTNPAVVYPIMPTSLGDEGTYLNLPGFTVTTDTTTDPVELTAMYW